MDEPDESLKLKVGVDAEGLGSLETGEELSISLELAQEIGTAVENELRERHTHLDEDTGVEVMAVLAPNRVVAWVEEPEEGSD